MSTVAYAEQIGQLCSQFKLPTVGAEAVPHFTKAGHMDALESLAEVLEMEADDRRQRRVSRLRRASKLPVGKTWDTFEHEMLPIRLKQQLSDLTQGDFLEHSVNVLAFGLPGTGKTHAMCAVGHRLVEAGRSVLFTPAYRLVQDLLAAKRDLELPRGLRKLDNVEFLIIDDLGYLPQDFSEWDRIFQNPMATAAAIDRVVHHSVILEFNLPSYRTGEAKQRQRDNRNDNNQKEVKRQE